MHCCLRLRIAFSLSPLSKSLCFCYLECHPGSSSISLLGRTTMRARVRVQAAAEQAHHQRMRQQQEAAARAEWHRQQESVSAAVDAAIAATSLSDVETLGKIQARQRNERRV
eukprot:2293435-Pleurochrysis_carterae.AAC.2